MKILNPEILPVAKICVVVNSVDSRDMSKYSNPLIRAGVKLTEILFVGLFNTSIKSFIISELRKAVSELEELLKVSSINIVIDCTHKVDKDGGYIRGILFKDILELDNNKWCNLGVIKSKLVSDDITVKLVCGVRAETIAREKNSRDIIDNEFTIKDESKLEFIEITTTDGLRECLKSFKGKKEIVLDIETNCIDFDRKGAKILCIQLGCLEEPNKAYLIWYEKTGVNVDATFKNNVKKFMQHLMPMKPIVAHNGSAFDIPWICMHFDIDPWSLQIIDTLVLGYLAMNSTRRVPLGLKELSFKHCGEYDIELDKFKKAYCAEHKLKREEFSYDFIPKDILAKYSFLDIIALIPLRLELQKLCENHIGGNLYEESFLPFYKDFSKLVSTMQVNGIPFDVKTAKVKLEEKYKDRDRLLTKILEDKYVKEAVNFINEVKFKKAMESYNKKVQEKLAIGKEFKGKAPDKSLGKYGTFSFDETFNPSSSEHKRILFFEVLRLKADKKTDSGLASVDSETAIKLFADNPQYTILEYFSKVAKLEKEITSFYEPYIQRVENSVDGRIRGFYRINGTISGRISMTSVNILQVPRDSDFKYLLGFPEDSDYFVIGDDVTNLEGNQLTLLSKDEALLRIKDEAKGDGHSWLGISMGNLGIECFKALKGLDNSKIEDIKFVKDNHPDLRHMAKTANFSCIFGITGKGIAKDLKISDKDGEDIVSGFWLTHKQAKEFFDSRELQAREKGYVDLIGGAKLLTPDASSGDIKIRSKAIKSSNNATIQSGSWITHRAMIEICNIIKEKGYKAKPLTPWHDACYYECHKDDILEVSIIIQEAMERPFMENQMYNLEAKPEVGRSFKGGFELAGDRATKEKLVEEFKEKYIMKGNK